MFGVGVGSGLDRHRIGPGHRQRLVIVIEQRIARERDGYLLALD
jgi:hypothetical protein